MTLCDGPSFAGDAAQHAKLAGVVGLVKGDNSEKRANGLVRIVGGRKGRLGVQLFFGDAGRAASTRLAARSIFEEIAEFHGLGIASQGRRAASVALQCFGS